MKITVEVSDALLARARRYARKARLPLRAVVEDGLRHVLDAETAAPAYVYEDRSVGNPGDPNPFEPGWWDKWKDIINARPGDPNWDGEDDERDDETGDHAA